MATLIETSKILIGAAAVYPNFKMQVTPEQFATAWQRHVGHLAPGALQAAMDRAVANSTFYPTVSDVLKAAGELAAGEPRLGLEAWHDLTEAVKKHNRNDPPGKPGGWEFPDPVSTEAAKLLGWATFCASDEDSLRWAFAKIYDALAGRRRADLARNLELDAPASAGIRELE